MVVFFTLKKFYITDYQMANYLFFIRNLKKISISFTRDREASLVEALPLSQ